MATKTVPTDPVEAERVGTISRTALFAALVGAFALGSVSTSVLLVPATLHALGFVWGTGAMVVGIAFLYAMGVTEGNSPDGVQ